MAQPDDGRNCTAQEGPVSADADIVGYGASYSAIHPFTTSDRKHEIQVLSAFIVAAALTVFAVVFGYLSGSLDDESMSALDRAIIKSARRYGRSIKRWLRRTFRRDTGSTPSAELEDDIQHPRSEAWKQAVSRFILALSDQQLVTGLAILVSGVARQRTLTAWEFYVVLSLAWFSTTSHLVTLDALRRYLKTHARVRDARVLGMLLVLILLIYMFIVTVVAQTSTLGRLGQHTFLIQCVFGQSDYSFPIDSINAIIILAWGIALLLVISSYYSRISRLYSGHGPTGLVMSRLIRWRFRMQLGADTSNLSTEELLDIGSAASRAASLAKVSTPARWWTDTTMGTAMGSTFQRLVRETESGMYLTSESFIASLVGIAFSLSYGITQLIQYRWMFAPPLHEDSISMGFGQIMAVFLLLLPPLTAAESYFGIFNPSSTGPLCN